MTEIVRVNWRFHIECIDCGEVYCIASANPSKEVVMNTEGKRNRIVILTIWNECPNCHNLRAVPGEVVFKCEPDDPDESA